MNLRLDCTTQSINNLILRETLLFQVPSFVRKEKHRNRYFSLGMECYSWKLTTMQIFVFNICCISFHLPNAGIIATGHF